jgi:signal transduction histidine kinase
VAVNTNPVYENGKVKGATVVVHDITERRKVEQTLRESEERLRSLSTELIKAQEKERRRISKELHDELGQPLAILKHRVRSIGKSLHSKQPQKETDIGPSVELIDRVIEKVRQISRDLNPSLLDDLGLFPALRNLTETLTEECEIPVSLDINDTDLPISKEVARNIYRICQEALNNIIKHAEANRVTIKMTMENETLSLFIEDDGNGFDPHGVETRAKAQRGLGLTVMQERAYLIGGSLEITGHADGRGTRVSLTVPIERADIK